MSLTTTEHELSSFRGTTSGLRLTLICILSLILMVLDHQNQHLVRIREALSIVVYPVQAVINAPFALGRWADETFSTRGRLLEENQELHQDVLMQSARLQRMIALEAENVRLRALLDSTAKVADRVLIAEIVSVDMNPFRHTILINKGGRDGVYVGQALIDAGGIVGQITRDQPFAAEAMLVTDADHALPVEIARNQLRTIAMGTGDIDRLALPFLPRNADVQPGDLLVSSGLGRAFPAGYPVGTIVDIRSQAGQPFLEVDAEPAAALNQIREVLLIWRDDDLQNALPDGQATIATEESR
ncbi:MAG: rod shape-determining protein MreC [Gammaproteobacteria bacterium]